MPGTIVVTEKNLPLEGSFVTDGVVLGISLGRCREETWRESTSACQPWSLY